MEREERNRGEEGGEEGKGGGSATQNFHFGGQLMVLQSQDLFKVLQQRYHHKLMIYPTNT